MELLGPENRYSPDWLVACLQESTSFREIRCGFPQTRRVKITRIFQDKIAHATRQGGARSAISSRLMGRKGYSLGYDEVVRMGELFP